MLLAVGGTLLRMIKDEAEVGCACAGFRGQLKNVDDCNSSDQTHTFVTHRFVDAQFSKLGFYIKNVGIFVLQT